MTDKKLYEELNTLIDPSYNKTFEALKSVTKFEIKNDIVEIDITLGNKELHQEELKLNIAKLVKIKYKHKGLKLNITQLQDKTEKNNSYIYIGIASGKGGVGKSNVTANLALALNKIGVKTAIIDADVYGASIPYLFNLEIKPLDMTDDDKIIPASRNDVQIVSTEFFMPEDRPVLWRGPMLGKLLTHYFTEVTWQNDTKIILIDLPPGTGDIALDIQEYVPNAKMIIVTTPSLSASHVAVKAGLAASEMGHEIIGVIENMSYFYDQESKKYHYIFGKDGAKKVASKLNTEVLAQLPLNQNSDKVYCDNDMNSKLFLALSKKIVDKLNL